MTPKNRDDTEDRSNSGKPNQTTLKTQFPLLKFVEALLVVERPSDAATFTRDFKIFTVSNNLFNLAFTERPSDAATFNKGDALV